MILRRVGGVVLALGLCPWPVLAQEARVADIRAQLSPRDFTTLAAEIGAKVERLTAREGERFTKGQVLISFDCSVNRAQLDEARATLSAANKTVAVNKRLLELQTVGKLETEVSETEADKARAKVAAMSAMAWWVLPRPISSASSPCSPFLNNHHSQRRPMS